MGIREGFDWTSYFDAWRARPSEHYTRIFLTFTVQVVEGLALPIAKELNKLLKFAFNKHFAEVWDFEQMLLCIRKTSHVLLVKSLKAIQLTVAI